MKYFRTACYEKKDISALLFYRFFKETKDTKDMSVYSNLLTTAVKSIQGQQEETAEQSIFDFGGFNNLFAGETADDFELVDFLVVE